MTSEHHSGSRKSIKLPRSWTGQVFVWKFLVPFSILGIGIFVTVNLIDKSLVLIAYYAALMSPLFVVGLFLFLVPVQLRENESGIAVRRWFHWKFVPDVKVESVRTYSIIGRAKITGRRMRISFFIEPQNERLLQGKRRSGSSRGRRKLPWGI